MATRSALVFTARRPLATTSSTTVAIAADSSIKNTTHPGPAILLMSVFPFAEAW